MKVCALCGKHGAHDGDSCPLAAHLPADDVERPKHYTSRNVAAPGEVIDVLEAWDLPHHLACVVKYIARHRDKGSAVKDLKKARWYLDRYLARLEKP